MPQEEFHNAPSETPSSQRLTNDDFRRLLMTPRAAPSSAPAAGSIREAMSHPTTMAPPKTEDRAELRRKKKSYYAKLKKQEDDKMAELAEKYRDRARERRDGVNPDYQNEDPLNTASAYRAVAPDLKSGMDAAERRRQMIQESKFLGGDMEHTHLVKGLDYALLQKVRSEIITKEHEQEQQLEELAMKSMEQTEVPVKEKEKKVLEKDEDEMHFETKIGRNIHRTICALKSRHIERNDLFVPGRMAYVIDLEDDTGDTDIPTTLIRSKAETPALDSTPTLTTNDIVINKLAQILTYLRQGNRHKNKKGRKDKTNTLLRPENERQQPIDDSIYGDIGDYVPTTTRSSGDQRDKERRSRNEDGRDRHDRDHSSDRKHNYFEKSAEEQNAEKVTSNAPQISSRSQKLLSRLAQEPEGYAECYPGLDEMQDAIDDSDDEVDYTKMDLGNKKGPVGRWDFDTQEEYSDYMNNKEALPKAAFQYGVKMADGRRTRKHKDKNEKAVLDREWQQIQNIIQKRKAPKDDGPEFKVPRY